VVRTFVKPFFRGHAPGLLTREAFVLTLLAGQEDIPAAQLVAIDATAEHCAHPCLLMSSLPGRVRADEDDLERRLDLLAAQLVRIHEVVPDERPRPYQAWTSPMGSPTRAKPRVGEGPHAGRAAVGAGGGRDPPRTPVLRGLFPAPVGGRLEAYVAGLMEAYA
jgi:hypothetical protein